MFFKKEKKIEDKMDHDELDLNSLPKHVAFIMDGNGRWAKNKKLPVSAGHLRGTERFDELIEASANIGIEVITFYAFSTENWRRDQKEINYLFSLIHKFYKEKFNKLIEEKVRIRFIGSSENVPEDLQNLFWEMEEQTKDFTRITVNIAFNYGGRQEIVDAVNKIKDQEVITEADISNSLYTAGQPDVDLMIRTSGEYRLSNFLLWQNAYAEFIFEDTLWPDYNEQEYYKSLKKYQNRNRRFGGR